jgi:hypothetical protein
MRCQGYRKYGSFMTFGPRSWEQCENEAIAMLEVKQEGAVESLPGCAICWQDAIDTHIEILNVHPILEGQHAKKT